MKHYFSVLALVLLLATAGCATPQTAQTTLPIDENRSSLQDSHRTPANDDVLAYSPSKNFFSPVLLVSTLGRANANAENDMNRLLASYENHVRYCFEKSLQVGASSHASHVFYFTVYSTGSIGAVTGESQQDNLQIQSFDVCISQMLIKIKVAASNGSNVFRWKVSTRAE